MYFSVKKVNKYTEKYMNICRSDKQCERKKKKWTES